MFVMGQLCVIIPSSVVPVPCSGSPDPAEYFALTASWYSVPGWRSFSTVVVVSPLTVTSFISPPVVG